MEYQVTARKWRPRLFGEVIGQEHVTRALRNAIISGKIPHAYLFSGPRGVGKTTTARILAKALNYPEGPTPDPDDRFPVCEEIMNGEAIDVREIDGASNRGIENIREIRENVSYRPLSSRYKIYIIDEVHMLTTEASNALLKTLEEPPEHVIFIMATTEAHKVLPTIRSRTQHYVFKRITNSAIVEQLKNISDKEKISYEEDALFLIADAADGSMRDAESIFDQIVLYTDAKIRALSVREVLGLPTDDIYKRMLQSIIDTNTVTLLEQLNLFLNETGDAKLLLKGLIEFLKKGLLVQKLPYNHELVDLSEKHYGELKNLFKPLSSADIVNLISGFVDAYASLKSDIEERFLLENAFFQALDYKNRIPLSVIREELLKVTSVAASGAHVKPMNRAMSSPHVARQAPVQNQQNNSPDAIKNTFKKILEKNPLTRHFISHIQSLEIKGSTLFVNVKTSHVAELLDKDKVEFEKKIESSSGVKISVLIRDLQSEKEKELSQYRPGENKTNSQETASQETASQETASQEISSQETSSQETAPQDTAFRETKKEKPAISSAIADLFEGKIKVDNKEK